MNEAAGVPGLLTAFGCTLTSLFDSLILGAICSTYNSYLLGLSGDLDSSFFKSGCCVFPFFLSASSLLLLFYWASPFPLELLDSAGGEAVFFYY